LKALELEEDSGIWGKKQRPENKKKNSNDTTERNCLRLTTSNIPFVYHLTNHFLCHESPLEDSSLYDISLYYTEMLLSDW
jgi:hypothetical protein